MQKVILHKAVANDLLLVVIKINMFSESCIFFGVVYGLFSVLSDIIQNFFYIFVNIVYLETHFIFYGS